MMSQNRQAAKDRLATALDYEIDVQAETEIAALHAKMDALHAHFGAIALSAVGRPATSDMPDVWLPRPGDPASRRSQSQKAPR
jgi:uncharacterized membrane protein